MPFPSAGCQTCKTRRIKCDQGQPICQKCMKARRICHGAGTGQQITVIHNENRYASGQMRRPRGPRSTVVVDWTDTLGTIQQPLIVDLKTQAVTYYFHFQHQALEDMPTVSRGVLDGFLSMWISRPDSLLLDLAVSSMALAVFSRIKQHPPAAIEASKQYHRLLKTTQTTIPSLNESNIDACLVATALMGRFEEVVYRPDHRNLESSLATRIQSFSHHDGALAMLRIWKIHLSHSQPATDVIKHTRRGQIRSALLRNLEVPAWMQDGITFGEYGLELGYDRIVVRLANVRQRLSILRKEKTGLLFVPHELASIAEQLNQDVQGIDEALKDWTTLFPSIWCYQQHNLPDPHPWPIRDFFSSMVYSYSSPAYAAVWNQYYATGMLVNSTRLKILEFIYSNVDDDFASEQYAEGLSRLTHLAEDLAASVPFCLQRIKVIGNSDAASLERTIELNTHEDIKPYLTCHLVWPLTIASNLNEVNEDLKSWFRSEISRIGRVIGNGVIECADSGQYFEL